MHVWDLARAHVLAVEQFDAVLGDLRYDVFNLGSGMGVTVRELVRAYEKVVGHKIRTEEVPARPGDVAGAFANTDKAWGRLGWETELSIVDALYGVVKWADMADVVG